MKKLAYPISLIAFLFSLARYAIREKIAIDTLEECFVQAVRFKALGADPGLVILEEADGTPHWMWVDSSDNLRIHTAAPSTPDSDGVVVGTQT